jgi:hypothetical protein
MGGLRGMMRAMVILGILIAVVLASTGCIAPQLDQKASLTGGEYGGGSSASPGDYSPAPVYANTPDYAPVSATDQSTDQKIITTSRINLEVQDVRATLDSLKSTATAHGGYVGSMSVDTRSGNRLYAVLTMRVPASAFNPVVTELKSLGILKSETLQADDVTEEYIDLNARRTALASQLTQYMRIMEKAENVSEILEVQEQIERVQVEIDRIDGRLKYLDNRVDYATITVSLQEPEPVGGNEGFSLVGVINDGIAGLLAVSAGLIILIISLIPLIIIAVIAYIVYRWYQGRKNKKQGSAPDERPGGGNPPGK